MSKKRNRNILLTITFVLTIIQILMFVFSGFVVAYNLFGFVDYYNQIKSGKLDETNVNEESIQEIYDLAIKVNKGLVPTEVLNLYNTIIGDEN